MRWNATGRPPASQIEALILMFNSFADIEGLRSMDQP
jgi:hypothetical protein